MELLLRGLKELSDLIRSKNSEFVALLKQANTDISKIAEAIGVSDAQLIAILVNNAFKTVQQSAKDKEDICRRADARQKYLTQISHSDGLD